MSPDPLPFFVYGTLRPGGRNHEPWLSGRVAAVVPARLAGHVLHHHHDLPYVVPGAGTVVGDLVHAPPDVAAEVLADLDVLEGVEVGHYERVRAMVEVVDGAPTGAWLYVAGPSVAAELGPGSAVASGDWDPWLGGS